MNSKKSYKIIVPNRVGKQLKRIPEGDRKQIVKVIKTLRNSPYPERIEKLTRNVYRMRVRRYRVIYKVIESERKIILGRVVKRNEYTYRGIESSRW